MVRARYQKPFVEVHTYLLRLLELPREIRDPAIDKIARLFEAYQSYCARIDCARPEPVRSVHDRVCAKMERVVAEAEEKSHKLRDAEGLSGIRHRVR